MKAKWVLLCCIVLIINSLDAQKSKKKTIVQERRKWRKHIEGSCVIHACTGDWHCGGVVKVFQIDELIENVWVKTYAGCQEPPYQLGPSRCCRFPRVPETREYYMTHGVGK